LDNKNGRIFDRRTAEYQTEGHHNVVKEDNIIQDRRPAEHFRGCQNIGHECGGRVDKNCRRTLEYMKRRKVLKYIKEQQNIGRED
jgi:hypothetical protein